MENIKDSTGETLEKTRQNHRTKKRHKNRKYTSNPQTRNT